LKRTLIVLASLICALPLFAGEWHPVVGVMGKLDFDTDGPDLWPHDWYVWRTDHSKQFELGERNGRYEIYVGYHLATSVTDQSSNYGYGATDSTWSNSSSRWSHWTSLKRVLVGYRYWTVPEQYAVRPVLGGAIGYGWVTEHQTMSGDQSVYTRSRERRFQWDQTYQQSWGWSDEQYSSRDWDALVEAGVAVRFYQNADVLALAQLHTHFTRWGNYNWWESYGTVTAALGVRYTFGNVAGRGAAPKAGATRLFRTRLTCPITIHD
jgi:hypothetical protein